MINIASVSAGGTLYVQPQVLQQPPSVFTVSLHLKPTLGMTPCRYADVTIEKSLGNNRRHVYQLRAMNPETLQVQICIISIATTIELITTIYRVSVHTRRAAPELVRLVMAVIYSK